MKIEGTKLLFLLVSLSLIVANVEAGWKFWKKKDKETTTTTTTTTTTPTPEIGDPSTKATPIGANAPTTGKPSSRPNAGSAIIGAGNPGLAVGVGTTGENIRNNARPQKPNPGTEVGLDLPNPGRPGVGGNNGQGYREWAADLTGAGEPGRQPPKLPSQGPALSAGDTRPASLPGNTPLQPQPSGAGSRPVSAPGNVPSQPQTPGSRPSSVPGSPVSAPGATPGYPTPQSRPGSSVPGAGGNQVSTLNIGTLKPAGATTPSPSRPGSPIPSGSPGQPGRTWADVAGGGSRPNSPTPSPRHPSYPNQPASGPTPSRPQTPTQPRPSGGTIGAPAGAAAAAAGATAGGKQTYSSNPTYSKGNGITDEDLEKLSEALYIKDSNNANRYITVNLQKQISDRNSVTDETPQPLLTVNPEAYQIPTIQRVLAIFDNYQLDTHTNEFISPAQRQEESLLVDTFLSTNVMSAAMRFLADKGHVRKDYYEYKDTLRKIWFNLFSRGQGKIGSTGFEHVFMTELRVTPTGTEVLGLHNWIYFAKEEASRRVDYFGYLKKVDLGNKASIIKIRTKFNGHDKPVTTMFIGTSPELEMALYTVCFYARPDGNCPVSLGGTKFNIVTHKFRYRGNDLVGTAYPEI